MAYSHGGQPELFLRTGDVSFLGGIEMLWALYEPNIWDQFSNSIFKRQIKQSDRVCMYVLVQILYYWSNEIINNYSVIVIIILKHKRVWNATQKAAHVA